MLGHLFQRAHRSALLWSWLNTALRVGAALFILPLAVRLIPRDEFGLWYVFLALGNFSMLLEMGFSQTIGVNASFLWAGAGSPRALGLPEMSATDSTPAERLAPLVRTFVRFYQLVGAGVFLLLLCAGSFWIWRQTEALDARHSLRMAWFVFAAGFAINFSGSVWSAILNGINRVRETQQSQLIAATSGLTLSLVGLLLGWRVWALVSGQVLTGLLTWNLVRHRLLKAVPELRSFKNPPNWKLLPTLWPLAWRNGIGSLGMFLVTQANTLICSAFLDLRATASYGLSVQLANTLASVSGMFIQVRIPYLAQMRITQGNHSIAQFFAQRVTWFTLMFAAGAILLVSFGPWGLKLVGSQTPLLSTPLLALLLLAIFLTTHHCLYAALVLTENQNPFVAIGLFSAIASAGFSALLTQRWGVIGLIAAPGIVQACTNNWYVVLRGIRGMDLTVREYLRIWKQGWKRHNHPRA